MMGLNFFTKPGPIHSPHIKPSLRSTNKAHQPISYSQIAVSLYFPVPIVPQNSSLSFPTAHTHALSQLKMLRQAPRFLLSRASGASMRWGRQFATDLPSETATDPKFIDDWKKVMPNMDPPKTPSAYMKPRPPTPSTIPSKLTVNLVLPYNSVLSGKEVDMVIVPATTGQMGVLPGHVPTIAELKPGLLTVHEGNDVSKYFLSGGFAFVHGNSVADIIAVEATPVDRIDPNLVQKGLAEFQQKLNSASTDVEKAEAQIGVDLHSALNAALTG
ncbi:hypothetical protein CASFOL_003048 [Castilleja foliolosa]|uniref:ATP synthase F1 complex delta/epsilon subunit N-terminal domain-containing protein n=1 Tax=Castilleja foliolosa TaxID=1961234 RepID=A0ABD3EGI0_9LAMI